MKIAIAQIAPIVGDFDKNVAQISTAYERACSLGVRLVLFPELCVTGYPPHDLMDRPEIFERTEAALSKVAALTKGKKTALIVGHVARNSSHTGRAARNTATLFEDGKAVFSQSKTLLPTYDVFDEARYFEPSEKSEVFTLDGKKIGLAICEDYWGDDEVMGRKIYGKSPIDQLIALKPDVLLSISASPYEFGKREHREALHGAVAKKAGAPLIYVNQYGATDDVLFDGASFSVDKTGKVTGRLKAFDAAFGILESDTGVWDSSFVSDREDQAPDELDVLIRGLICGIREYFARTGFKLSILGLSGGIDSAVVATLAVQALGAKNVLGIAMPSQFSSSHSLADAEALAKALQIPFEVSPIKFLYSTAQREIGQPRGGLSDIAQENLQSRMRGMILMTLANHYNALVLTTGNKSEIATGYCTLYGDMCGAIAPIGDVLKTRVYEIANRLNELYANPIPKSTITKAPSAELKPDQTDQDTLPPYDKLDGMLEDYLENFVSVKDLEKKYGAWVRDILKRIELNEYKRRQGAPVLKVSSKAFGVGRRVPIAKVWDQRV